MIFVLVGFAYALCVLAKKEEGLIKTVGNTLAICFVIFTMAYVYMITDMELNVGFWRHDTTYNKLWHKHMPLKK
jgi:hypothetical protein